VVLHAAQAQRFLTLALTLTAVTVSGCGGDDSKRASANSSTSVAAPKVIHKDLGVDVRLADCQDWLRGDETARRGTIQEITGFAGGQVGSTPGNPNGAVLTENQAYALFERWCGQDFAGAFKLYKLYTRAAAFTPRS
jgi:hypothetical protein